MSLSVQLNIFSGRPNPRFTLSETEAISLFKRALEAGPASPNASRGLGYQGFTLLPVEPGSDMDAMSQDALGAASAHGLTLMGAPELEQELIALALKRLELSASVQSALSNAHEIPLLTALPQVDCPDCKGQNAPAYDPDWWNNNAVRLANNNCYNYANNQATNTFAQPGRASGTPIAGMSCGGVQPSAVSDGLVASANFSDETPGWYVALVIWPDTDFHWYRQDTNGCWSHKPGSTPVINTDNAGAQITDPATCDRGHYTQFCSYMITNSGVVIS
ncbi:hypothetical protein [Oceanicaulis alexandrii]|uniref:hypothetical protein n=1 Tax=Oceanicaulis alexandrii TaxID=153233 RepID=UPI0003B6D6AE|nr:hypothetical protein [Oceanicaulis alexandrii]